MKRIIKSTFLTIMLFTSAFIFTQSASAYCPVKYYKTCSCSYDCCNNMYYKTVTIYKSWDVQYRGYTCDCGCPKCYTYSKHYCCPVKSIKYYYCCPSNNCNTCNTCNTCWNGCGYGNGYGY